jgi:hypothetical protein
MRKRYGKRAIRHANCPACGTGTKGTVRLVLCKPCKALRVQGSRDKQDARRRKSDAAKP